MTGREIHECPAWCTERHDRATEARTGDADHAAAFLHELGGAFVALHRLDPDGETRVLIDPGPAVEPRPEGARKFAHAIMQAVEAASASVV